jgi:hypothetical protein
LQQAGSPDRNVRPRICGTCDNPEFGQSAFETGETGMSTRSMPHNLWRTVNEVNDKNWINFKSGKAFSSIQLPQPNALILFPKSLCDFEAKHFMRLPVRNEEDSL